MHVVVWNGSTAAAHRGYLCCPEAQHPTRPAPRGVLPEWGEHVDRAETRRAEAIPAMQLTLWGEEAAWATR